jgi:peptidoglycan-N-acetylglucosamine deacetylase
MSKDSCLTITLDIEDHRGDAPGPKRHAVCTRELLDLLARYRVQGTFFVVGDLIETDADLLRQISEAGHEIGLHSFNHKPLRAHTLTEFQEQTHRAKARLEDCISAAVIGYRAPSFSLTAQTHWVTDILPQLGFGYSSSTLPAGSPLYGYPGLPKTPFRWPSGLLELPSPITKVGPLTVPFLGGIYFRYLPRSLIRRALRDRQDQTALWSYLHPYDIDAAEPFCRPHGAPLWMSILLWANRRPALAKLEWLLEGGAGLPVGNPLGVRLVAGEFEAAPPLPLNPCTERPVSNHLS